MAVQRGPPAGTVRRVPPRGTETNITSTTLPPVVRPSEFEEIVVAHLDGRATDEEIALLERRRDDWVQVLWRLLDRADRVIEDAKRSVRGPARNSIIEDFDREAYRIDEVLTQLIGPPSEDELDPRPDQQRPRRQQPQQPRSRRRPSSPG